MRTSNRSAKIKTLQNVSSVFRVSVHDKPTPLADTLRRNRLQQKHVADALGVSRISVMAWVHGRSTPTGRNLARLRDYLRQFEPSVDNEDIVGRVA